MHIINFQAGKENAPFSTAKFKNFMEMCLTKRRMSEMRKRLAVSFLFHIKKKSTSIRRVFTGSHSTTATRKFYSRGAPRLDTELHRLRALEFCESRGLRKTAPTGYYQYAS